MSLPSPGATGQPRPSGSLGDRARPTLFALAPAAVLLVFLWPVISGEKTWYLRDLFSYHLAVKAAQARAMRDGFLPLIDPLRAGGQALVGNLNNVALYPDNLLYLAAPVPWALSAHLWLHLLLAPVAMYGLARVWGLAREAAWVAGFCYGLSGFFLSQLNLYNLVAGAALAPALAAACVAAAGAGRRSRLAAAGAGALWALVLLAGDPIVAALALVLGLGSVLASGGRDAARLLRLGVGLALGTLVAAPQLVELARIMDTSYRGSLGLSTQSRLMSSWDPRQVVDLLVPLFFGPPDQRHWGDLVLGSSKPLYFTLYPGLVAVALLLASGRPRTRVSRWAWAVMLGGGFLALGGWNPLMFYVYRLPQAAALRYPIKAWLLVAIGGAVLAGIGFERTVLEGRRAALLKALAAVGAVAAAGWLGLARWNGPVVEGLRARITPTFPAALAIEEVARWRAALLISLSTLLVAAVLAAASRRAPRLAGSALITAYVASQLVLLQPLLDADLTAAFRAPPRPLSYLRAGERIAHGCPISFACDLGGPGRYPDWRMSWIARRGWLELYPFAGAQFGVRYAFNNSPEGLDTVLTVAGSRALSDLGDAEALRVLAAAAVDVVLLGRAVDESARDLVRLRARLPSLAGELWVYELRHPATEVRLAERVVSGDTRGVMRALLASDFDPARDVFLPGRPEEIVERVGGEAVLRAEGWERLRVATESRSDGLLVLGRAWLPHYRATVDGTPARTLQVNLGQLAIEVPAGAREVEIWIDRAPFRRALWGALAGAIGLVALAFGSAGSHRRGRRLSDPVR